MTVIEVFQHQGDPGLGKAHLIHLLGGVLVPQDEFAASVLKGQRFRNHGLTDTQLADKLQGWSNGYTGIRLVPDERQSLFEAEERIIRASLGGTNDH